MTYSAAQNGATDHAQPKCEPGLSAGDHAQRTTQDSAHQTAAQRHTKAFVL
jgi:hypothetical protein